MAVRDFFTKHVASAIVLVATCFVSVGECGFKISAAKPDRVYDLGNNTSARHLTRGLHAAVSEHHRQERLTVPQPNVGHEDGLRLHTTVVSTGYIYRAPRQLWRNLSILFRSSSLGSLPKPQPRTLGSDLDPQAAQGSCTAT